MSEAGSGAHPLLVVAVVLSAAIGVLVWSGAPDAPHALTGVPAPPVELEGLDGRPLALEDFAGRVMFVNFWGTWCAPCREEAPALEQLYRELRDDGFSIVAISVDAADAGAEIEAFREEFGLSFPIAHDPEKRAYRAFGVTGVPETFLIDTRGVIVEHFLGPRDWGAPQFRRTIRRLQAAAHAGGRS